MLRMWGWEDNPWSKLTVGRIPFTRHQSHQKMHLVMNKLILLLSLICTALSEAAADKGFNFGEEPFHRVESACRFNNPLKDLEWLQDIHRKKPDYSICMYKRNGKVLFKIFRCGKDPYPVFWYDCTGYKICQSMRASCSAVEGCTIF